MHLWVIEYARVRTFLVARLPDVHTYRRRVRVTDAERPRGARRTQDAAVDRLNAPDVHLSGSEVESGGVVAQAEGTLNRRVPGVEDQRGCGVADAHDVAGGARVILPDEHRPSRRFQQIADARVEDLLVERRDEHRSHWRLGAVHVVHVFDIEIRPQRRIGRLARSELQIARPVVLHGEVQHPVVAHAVEQSGHVPFVPYTEPAGGMCGACEGGRVAVIDDREGVPSVGLVE